MRLTRTRVPIPNILSFCFISSHLLLPFVSCLNKCDPSTSQVHWSLRVLITMFSMCLHSYTQFGRIDLIIGGAAVHNEFDKKMVRIFFMIMISLPEIIFVWLKNGQFSLFDCVARVILMVLIPFETHFCCLH